MGPSHAQAWRLRKMCLIYRDIQDEHLNGKDDPTPDVVGDDEDHYVSPLQIPPPKGS
jgi:hypothetical protein